MNPLKAITGHPSPWLLPGPNTSGLREAIVRWLGHKGSRPEGGTLGAEPAPAQPGEQGMASPAPVACAPLAGSFEKAAGAWNQLRKSSPVQRNTVLVLLLPVYQAREVLREWGSAQETGGWGWALPSWAPTLGEGTEPPGLAFQADPALVSCPAP